MYAVVKTGGKQYRVAKDDIIKIERLPGEAGDVVTLEEVLMLGEGQSVTVGAPVVAGASVAGEILEQARGKKIIVFKKRRRQNYRRKKGHRQDLTVLKVTEILTDGAKPAAKKAAPKAASKPAPKEDAPTAAEGDDLTKLSGVGPVLAQKLADAGVTSLRRSPPGVRTRLPNSMRNCPSKAESSAKAGSIRPRNSPRAKRSKTWRIKKQAVRPATVAIPSVAVSA